MFLRREVVVASSCSSRESSVDSRGARPRYRNQYASHAFLLAAGLVGARLERDLKKSISGLTSHREHAASGVLPRDYCEDVRDYVSGERQRRGEDPSERAYNCT